MDSRPMRWMTGARAERQELVHYFGEKAAEWAISRYNLAPEFRGRHLRDRKCYLARRDD